MNKTTNIFKKHPLAGAIVCMGLPFLLMGAGPAVAQNAEIEELRRQLRALEQKLDETTARIEAEAGAARADAREVRTELAAQQKANTETRETLAKSNLIVRDGKGIKIGDTTVTVGGYIKADAIYGSGGDGTTNNYSIGTPANISAHAASGMDDRWRLGASARDTRVGLRTVTPDVGGRDLTTYIEIDFHGANDGANEFVSNSYNPRLRLANASWGNWTVGQDHTTFTEFSGQPEILNSGKMAAFVYLRQPLLRYSMDVPGGRLFASIENPEDGGHDQAYPDLIARYQMRNDYGTYALAAMARSLEKGNTSERSLQGAVSLSANIPTFGKDNLRLQYSYGVLGRYAGLRTFQEILDTDSRNPNGTINADGELTPVVSYAATVGYQKHWSPKWRSNLSLSQLEVVTNTDQVVDPVGPNGTARYELGRYFDRSTSAHFNLLYAATDRVTLGLEYAYWDFGAMNEVKSAYQYEQLMASAKVDF